MSAAAAADDNDDDDDDAEDFFCDAKSGVTVLTARTTGSTLGSVGKFSYRFSWRDNDSKTVFSLKSMPMDPLQTPQLDPLQTPQLDPMQMDLVANINSQGGLPDAAADDKTQEATTDQGGAPEMEQATPTAMLGVLLDLDGDGGDDPGDEVPVVEEGASEPDLIVDLTAVVDDDRQSSADHKGTLEVSQPDEKDPNFWTRDKSEFTEALLNYLERSAGRQGVLSLASMREKKAKQVSEQPGPTGQGSELQAPMCRLVRPDGYPQDSESQDDDDAEPRDKKSAGPTYMLCSFHLAESPCLNVLRVPGLPLDAYNLGYKELRGRYQATLQLELVPIAELLPIVVTRSSEICWGKQCGANRVYDIRYLKNVFRLLAERGRIGEAVIIDRNNSNCYNPSTNEPDNPRSTKIDRSAFGHEGGYGRLSTWLHRQIELKHVDTETLEVLDKWMQAAHTVYIAGCERWMVDNGDEQDGAPSDAAAAAAADDDNDAHLWLAATKRSRKPHKSKYTRTDTDPPFRYRGVLPFARASLFVFNTFYVTNDHRSLASWLAEQPEPAKHDEAAGQRLAADLREKLVDVVQLIVRLSQTLAKFPHGFYSREKNGSTSKRRDSELVWEERGCFVSTAVSVYNVLLVRDTEEEEKMRLAFNKKSRDNRPWTKFKLSWPSNRTTGALLKVCKWHVGRLPPEAARHEYQLMKTYNLLHQLEREQLHENTPLANNVELVEKDKKLLQPATKEAWVQVARECQFDDCQKHVAGKFRKAAMTSVSRARPEADDAGGGSPLAASYFNAHWLQKIQEDTATVDSECNKALADLQPMEDLRAGETAMRYRCLCASLPTSGDHGLPPPELQESESSPFVLAQLVLLASSLYTLGLPPRKQLPFEQALLTFVWERLRSQPDSLYRLLANLAEDEACRLFSERSPELLTTSPSCLTVLEMHCQVLKARQPRQPLPTPLTPPGAARVYHPEHPVRRLLRLLTAHPFFVGWTQQQQRRAQASSPGDPPLSPSLQKAAEQLYLRKLYLIDYAYHLKFHGTTTTTFTPNARHAPGLSLHPALDDDDKHAGWVTKIQEAIEQRSAAPVPNPAQASVAEGGYDYVYLCSDPSPQPPERPRTLGLPLLHDNHASLAWWKALTTRLGSLPADSRKEEIETSGALAQQTWYIKPPQPAQESDDDDGEEEEEKERAEEQAEAAEHDGGDVVVPAARKRRTRPAPLPGGRRRRRLPSETDERLPPPPAPAPRKQKKKSSRRPRQESVSSPAPVSGELAGHSLGAVLSLDVPEPSSPAFLDRLMSGRSRLPSRRATARGSNSLSGKRKRQVEVQRSPTSVASPVPSASPAPVASPPSNDPHLFLSYYLENPDDDD